MKQYRIINPGQSIASFMIGFEKNEMTYDEYNEWSEYLKNTLTTGNVQAFVYYGKNYLDQLKHEDAGFLFDFGDKSIKIASGKTTTDLDQYVMSYMDVDTLLAVLDAVDSYQKEGEGLGK